MLPSETECAALASVSRETVRKAMNLLSGDGVLVSKRGHGTFTAKPHIATGLNRVQGFTEAVTSKGRRASTVVVRLDREVADLATSTALQIKKGGEVWALERIRHVDDIPAMVETAYLDVRLFTDLDKQLLTGSLYGLMQDGYRLHPEFGEESIFAINADRKLARQLDVPIAAALLASTRISFTRHRVPLERTMRFVRPELCSYSVLLAESTGLRVRSEFDSD
jgi:GntR family transcriptional regulator